MLLRNVSLPELWVPTSTMWRGLEMVAMVVVSALDPHICTH